LFSAFSRLNATRVSLSGCGTIPRWARAVA